MQSRLRTRMEKTGLITERESPENNAIRWLGCLGAYCSIDPLISNLIDVNFSCCSYLLFVISPSLCRLVEDNCPTV